MERRGEGYRVSRAETRAATRRLYGVVFFKIRNHDRCRTGRDGDGDVDGDAPESSYAMVKFTPDCDCEGTGACATGAPAVAITSRSPAAVAGRQPTSPTRSGKRAPSRDALPSAHRTRAVPREDEARRASR